MSQKEIQQKSRYHSTALSLILKDMKNLEANYWIRLEFNKIIGLWTNTYTTRQIHSLDDQRTQLLWSQILKRLKLHGWKSLSECHFLLNRCEDFTTRGLEIFAKNLPKYSQKLDAIKLDFERCPDILGKGLRKLGFQICKNLSFLKEVSLSFSWCSLQDRGIIQFLKQTTIKLKHLETLELDLSACYITDIGVQYLSSHLLKKIRTLKQLKLLFGWNHQISKKGIESLLGSISQSLVHLSSLNLDFKNCTLNDLAIEKIGIKTKNRLKFLKDLEMNLCNCKGITNKALQSLGFCIGNNFKQLASLTLVLRECRGVDDEGIQQFCDGIAGNLQDLQKISLDFQKCIQITNNSLKELGSHLSQNYSNLKEISLIFNYCPKIDDEGFPSLLQQIFLLDLEVLNLNFAGCPSLTAQILRDLFDNVKHITVFKGMKEFILNLAQCHLIHQDIKLLTTKKLLNFIPLCKIK